MKSLLAELNMRYFNSANGLDEFINALQNRIVRFSYKKTDGSVREAIGTMKPSVLSTLSAKMQSGQKRRSTGCIVYFDLEREDWRCFRPENFLSIL